MLLDLEKGAFLVKLARLAAEEYLKRGVKVEPPPETPPRRSSGKRGESS